jgi:lambda family phage portal protein
MAEQLFGIIARAARKISPPAPLSDPSIEAAPSDPRPAAVNPNSPLPARYGWWHGEKFPGGLGPANLLQLDYWTLRARSVEAFSTNLYARGLIRRLVTNVVNTGLELESTPSESVLGMEEEALVDWSELIESRFELWARSPKLCDKRRTQTFGQIQADAFREAFISGDALLVLQQDDATKLPLLKLIDGSSVQTPMEKAIPQPGQNRVIDGVEVDEDGRHVAYYVRQSDGLASKRLRARDDQGRRVAWLVYACDKRHNDVRGEPILSLVLQSLKEIDRYRDATLRKAVLNAFLAMYLKSDPVAATARSFTGGAITRGSDTVQDTGGTQRTFNTAEFIPGLILDALPPGVEPKGFQPQATDDKFGDFEEAMVHTIAWTNNIPPEILRLAFSHNYSASQAANNEFNLYLYLARHDMAVQVCQPVFEDWLISEALMQRFDHSQEILAAWGDPALYDAWAAWTETDWSGQIKPASDILKVTNAHATMCENGFELRSRAARELTGQKYRRFVKTMRRENELLAEALKPLEDLKAAGRQPPGQPQEQSARAIEQHLQDIEDRLEERESA